MFVAGADCVGIRLQVATEHKRHLGVGAERRRVGVKRRVGREQSVRREVADGELVADALGIANAELPADRPGARAQDLAPAIELQNERSGQARIDVAVHDADGTGTSQANPLQRRRRGIKQARSGAALDEHDAPAQLVVPDESERGGRDRLERDGWRVGGAFGGAHALGRDPVGDKAVDADGAEIGERGGEADQAGFGRRRTRVIGKGRARRRRWRRR